MTLLDLITALTATIKHFNQRLSMSHVSVRVFDGNVEYIITALVGTKDGVLVQLQRKDVVQDVV